MSTPYNTGFNENKSEKKRKRLKMTQSNRGAHADMREEKWFIRRNTIIILPKGG